ncbi:MAG: alkaline phosphatase family protein [Lachnospiraceae bacterium]|nr:alkaline phosphatase family protein [Lachnospiraceae bacterium]
MAKKKCPYNVILISVDAVASPDAESFLALPAFKYFTERGCFTDNVNTIYPTITYPIHTSAITGKYPERHSIAHNEPWQPDVNDKMRKWYWAVKDIGTRTLWHAAREKKLSVASLLWPVSGKATGVIKWDFPEVLPLPGEVPVIKMMQYASKLWLAVTELRYSKFRQGLGRCSMDDYMALLCEKLIEKKNYPDLITVHFADTDDTRHNKGVGTEEDKAAILRMDRRVQRLIDAVKKRGIEDRTVFAVMSDHGQQNIEKGYIPLDAKLCDAKLGRAQSLGMGAYIYADDLEKTRTFLEENSSELHIKYILKNEELRKIRAPREVVLAVQAEDGYGYVDRNCECDHLGDHGFGLEAPGAKTLLWLVGGPFKKGVKIGGADIVDIAPTIAEVMGLAMDDCDGKAISEAFEKPLD